VQILECVAVTAIGIFVDTLQAGLGVVPDFEPPSAFTEKKAHLLSGGARPSEGGLGVPLLPVIAVEDPDAGLVAEVQGGRVEVFEELIHRHTRCIYRTLMAILADPEETKDAMQETLLSAFKHIGGFKGRSKFSTWLVSIARNTAFQRLRQRKNVESLDEDGSDRNEDFRPRQVRAWQDDPEQLHSKEEIRQIVERGIMGLPAKYRVVVMLRDIEQLPTDDVAKLLGLSVPATKTRLVRGRLMLREALSRHFTVGAEKAGA
jgi:RNA polymerase sigma-70 factor, ECF subfamily